MKPKDRIKNNIVFSIAVCLLFNFFQAFDGKSKTFQVKDNQFFLDGIPYVIKAAELHYPRIPKEYWEHRIKMSKALGMNTICLYVFWNIHEQTEGNFDFTGQNDLGKFIELCRENDLNVILRPGPYVCAEWEMGGLPWWLLKNKDINLRDSDPYFLEKVAKFQEAVAKEVEDLTVDKGGPIIMIQVENEYGAYGENKEYVGEIRDILRKNFGDEITLFQCDWSSNFKLNGLEDLLWTMNFGTGADIDSQFEELKQSRPESPLMCSEYWSGWFDKWGDQHETRPADEMIEGIDQMLSKGISFSLYMTHGGTNWGHWAGANSPGYSPDVTSYDYDAPISENGMPTEKFWKLKKVLEKYKEPEVVNLEIPESIIPITLERFEIDEMAPLWTNLPAGVLNEEIKTFEELGMGFGSVVYETTLPEIKEGTILEINEPHDYAQIFIDDEFIGALDRRKGEKRLALPPYESDSNLKILVEGMGRINFGRAIKDFKGITEDVKLIDGSQNISELKGWITYLIPDSLGFYESLNFIPINKEEKEIGTRFPRGIYKGKFNVNKPSDSFLNMEKWGKGLVYVNGHPLGRFWEIGPQQTLYLPGPWLNEGENEILIFDILGPSSTEIEGLETPILDKVRTSFSESNPSSKELDFSKFINDRGETFTFDNSQGWKRVDFAEAQIGKCVLLEIETTYDDQNEASIAEIYLLDRNNNRLSREEWTVAASSSDTYSGNHTPDKIIDLQESTFWASENKGKTPHFILLKFSEETEVTGLEYLPRTENGTPGALKNVKIYVTK